MFTWMNKFFITEKMFLPRLLNRKGAVWWPITANQKITIIILKITKTEKDKIKNDNKKNEKMKKIKKPLQNYHGPRVPNLIKIYFIQKEKNTKLPWPMSAKSDT